VGKTAFSKALAAVFGVPMVVMQMSQSTGPFALGGLDAMFVSGGPGQLVRTVALGSHVDPVIVLDELDKTPASSSHDPLGPLFTLLDREAARSYVDEGLRLPLDLSWVKWIGTTNRVERLPEALRSRCRIFSIAPPTPAQGRGIAQALYADFDAKLSDAVAEAVAAHTPRTMARALHDALGEAAIAGRRSLLASDFPSLAPRRSAGFL
jgi:ATP-dependent Lon protease